MTNCSPKTAFTRNCIIADTVIANRSDCGGGTDFAGMFVRILNKKHCKLHTKIIKNHFKICSKYGIMNTIITML